jgi:hypothetical protein
MKNEIKTVSYIGKEVFIGIDVHKKNYAVIARVDCCGREENYWPDSSRFSKGREVPIGISMQYP